MTVVAGIFLPLVIAYQAWTYWVFRKRVAGPPKPSPSPLPLVPPRAPSAPTDPRSAPQAS
jgi:cytochrome d ubiquinol oxidase subunit II